jgi:hypothetical protein
MMTARCHVHQRAQDPRVRGAQCDREAGTLCSILRISVPWETGRKLGRVSSDSQHQRQIGEALYAWLSLLIVGWGRATILLSVLEVRHGSLDSTPAQDFVSSLIGLKDFVALWENFRIAIKQRQVGCVFFSTENHTIFGELTRYRISG